MKNLTQTHEIGLSIPRLILYVFMSSELIRMSAGIAFFQLTSQH